MSSQPPEGQQPQQQPGAAPSYPRMPESSVAGAARPEVAQPPAIRTAVRLMWAGAVLSLLSLVVTLATLGSLKSQIRDQLDKSGQRATDAAVNAGYAAAIAFSVVVTLISIGLWLWMAWKNGQGRSWARVVATVLGLLNLLLTILSLVGGRATALSLVIEVVTVILAVVVLVLLWRRESSEFYAAHSAPTR